MSRQLPASLSLDLDNKWAYLRAAGREDWQSCDSYFSTTIPRIVDMLGELELPLSVFLVGRDLDRDDDISSIGKFGSLGDWEAANHSLNHLPWMHTMSESEIEEEVSLTHQRIVSATGQTPVGFRGPGFSCPAEVLRVLGRLGYLYDASIFPTSMAPVARAVFLARTKLQGEQREKAKKLYGGFASMRHPNRPFQRPLPAEQSGVTGKHASRTIWEIPVTVLPALRTPIHFSYLTFLASHNVAIAKTYFRTALRTCRFWNVSPSLLLHPPDFLGGEDDRDMAYFPGMKMKRAAKIEFMRWALALYAKHFDVVTLRKQVERLSQVDPSSTPLLATQPSIHA